MANKKSAASSAVVYVNGPACFWLDDELVMFELPSGEKAVCGAMSASNFIESFSRAAEIAHQWSIKHYADGVHRSRAH